MIRSDFPLVVLPYYNPFHITKQAATVDYLSNGRLILGVGVGWMKDEFDILRVRFNERGAIADEYIQLIRALWRGDEQYSGRYYAFSDAYFPAVTAQKYPPIMVGGASEGALRRVARYGDGWLTIGVTVEGAAKKMEILRKYLAEYGRSESEITISGGGVNIDFGAGLSALDMPNRTVGSVPAEPDAILQRIRGWADIGVSYCTVGVGSFEVPIDEWLRRMEWFAENVMPRAKDL